MEQDIKEKVLETNEKVHDLFAKNHNKCVAYISRLTTRNYIWNIIKKQLKRYNKDSKNAKVLEVACGTGTFAPLFCKLKAKSYTGIDISGEMIKIAKENNKNNNNVSFEKISLEEYAKKHQNEFDIIIASSFLHHLTDLKEGLDEIKSMLKSEGIFIALHEEINNRTRTKIEALNEALGSLFGWCGKYDTPLGLRIFDFLKYIGYNNPILKIYSFPNKEKLMLFKYVPIFKAKTSDNYTTYYLFGFIPIFKKEKLQRRDSFADIRNTFFENNVNLLDYQLNFDFNLANNEIANKYGEVIPYCYYDIIELRFLKSNNNFNMFVMTKNKEL